MRDSIWPNRATNVGTKMFARAVLCLLLLTTAACENALRGAPPMSLREGSEQRRDPLAIAVAETLTEDAIRNAVRTNDVATRNQVVYARLAELDRLYFEYERSIGTEARTAGLGAALAAVGIGVGGTLTTAATASRLFSAGSSLIAGAQTAFSEQVLADRTLQALVSQMRANRDRIKARIILSLRRNITEYPLLAGLMDLELYRHAGTIQGALTALSETAAAEEQTRRRELNTTEERVRNISPNTVTRLDPRPAPRPLTDGVQRREAVIRGLRSLADENENRAPERNEFLIFLRDMQNFDQNYARRIREVLTQSERDRLFTDPVVARNVLARLLAHLSSSARDLATWEERLSRLSGGTP